MSDYQRYVDGKCIEKVSSTKYLGLQLDSRLNFKEHTDALLKKVNFRLGIIYRQC